MEYVHSYGVIVYNLINRKLIYVWYKFLNEKSKCIYDNVLK